MKKGLVAFLLALLTVLAIGAAMTASAGPAKKETCRNGETFYQGAPGEVVLGDFDGDGRVCIRDL